MTGRYTEYEWQVTHVVLGSIPQSSSANLCIWIFNFFYICQRPEPWFPGAIAPGPLNGTLEQFPRPAGPQNWSHKRKPGL